jgi:hypothetical protein
VKYYHDEGYGIINYKKRGEGVRSKNDLALETKKKPSFLNTIYWCMLCEIY